MADDWTHLHTAAAAILDNDAIVEEQHGLAADQMAENGIVNEQLMPAETFLEAHQNEHGVASPQAEAAIMQRLHDVLTGPSRNIFEHAEIKRSLIKPLEVYNKALTGRFNAKSNVNTSDKESIAQLKKDISAVKTIITGWLLKRESLLSRFWDNRLNKYSFAKFVLKNPAYNTPSAADICATYLAFTKRHIDSIRLTTAHYVKVHLAVIYGLRTYLETHKSYVDKMDRLNARAGNAVESFANAINLRRMAYQVIMDCFAADYHSFKFDVVIDHDDQMTHYDYIHVSEGAQDAADLQNTDEAIRQDAVNHVNSIMDVIGGNGGNREALMFNFMMDETIEEFAEDSPVRAMIHARQQQQNDAHNHGGDPTKISSENDATAIITSYILPPKDYNPAKKPTIVRARSDQYWQRQIAEAQNGNPDSRRLLEVLPAPIGQISYEQAMTRIIQHYSGDEKFETEVEASGVTQGVMPFSFILKYCVLYSQIVGLEEEGRADTDEYRECIQLMDQLCPEAERASMVPYIQQYRSTIAQFERTGVADLPFANPTLLAPGSAVQCFPDNCDSSADAEAIVRYIDSYFTLVESLNNTEDAIKASKSFANGNIADMAQAIRDMTEDPSLDDLTANDAAYFDKHYDAPWVDQVGDTLKTSMYRLATEQSEIIRQQQAMDVEKTWNEIDAKGIVIPEGDRELWRSKIELAFQRKPEDYIVQGHTQTCGSDGKTQEITIKYITPAVAGMIKATKMDEKSPVKWNIIAQSVWDVVCQCAQENNWDNSSGAINNESLLAAVCQVMNMDYYTRFTSTLLTNIKTSIVAQERATNQGGKKRRKRTLTPNMIDNEVEDHICDLARDGKLVVSSGSTKKKKCTTFVP